MALRLPPWYSSDTPFPRTNGPTISAPFRSIPRIDTRALLRAVGASTVFFRSQVRPLSPWAREHEPISLFVPVPSQKVAENH